MAKTATMSDTERQITSACPSGDSILFVHPSPPCAGRGVAATRAGGTGLDSKEHGGKTIPTPCTLNHQHMPRCVRCSRFTLTKRWARRKKDSRHRLALVSPPNRIQRLKATTTLLREILQQVFVGSLAQWAPRHPHPTHTHTPTSPLKPEG